MTSSMAQRVVDRMSFDVAKLGHYRSKVLATVASAIEHAMGVDEGNDGRRWRLEPVADVVDCTFDDGRARTEIRVEPGTDPSSPQGAPQLAVRVREQSHPGIGPLRVRFSPPAEREKLAWYRNDDYDWVRVCATGLADVCKHFGGNPDELWLEPDGSILFFIQLPDTPPAPGAVC